jgi:hypothetical protein
LNIKSPSTIGGKPRATIVRAPMSVVYSDMASIQTPTPSSCITYTWAHACNDGANATWTISANEYCVLHAAIVHKPCGINEREQTHTAIGTRVQMTVGGTKQHCRPVGLSVGL